MRPGLVPHRPPALDRAQQRDQKTEARMKTIEIWPKEVHGGDAVGDGITVQYLRLIDPEDGLEVIAFIRPEALETLFQQLAAMRGAQAKAN